MEREERDEARKYALQSEMEQLSGDAKSVLVAAISNSPISFAELEMRWSHALRQAVSRNSAYNVCGWNELEI